MQPRLAPLSPPTPRHNPTLFHYLPAPKHPFPTSRVLSPLPGASFTCPRSHRAGCWCPQNSAGHATGATYSVCQKVPYNFYDTKHQQPKVLGSLFALLALSHPWLILLTMCIIKSSGLDRESYIFSKIKYLLRQLSKRQHTIVITQWAKKLLFPIKQCAVSFASLGISSQKLPWMSKGPIYPTFQYQYRRNAAPRKGKKLHQVSLPGGGLPGYMYPPPQDAVLAPLTQLNQC